MKNIRTFGVLVLAVFILAMVTIATQQAYASNILRIVVTLTNASLGKDVDVSVSGQEQIIHLPPFGSRTVMFEFPHEQIPIGAHFTVCATGVPIGSTGHVCHTGINHPEWEQEFVSFRIY